MAIEDGLLELGKQELFKQDPSGDLYTQRHDTIVYLMKQTRVNGKEPLEGEKPKSEKELVVSDLVSRYVDEELDELGIAPLPSIVPEQLHFLEHDIYRSHFGGSASAFVISSENAAYIDLNPWGGNWDDTSVVFKHALHEGFEIACFKKGVANYYTRQYGVLRHGYELQFPSSPLMSFTGFKEAVINRLNTETMVKHGDEIEKKLGVTPHKDPYVLTQEFIDILNAIIERISQTESLDESVVWAQIKRGNFSGELKHLRSIDKAFGKGSLRVLALLGSVHPDPSDDELLQPVRDYFFSDSDHERQQIFQNLQPSLQRLKPRDIKQRV